MYCHLQKASNKLFNILLDHPATVSYLIERAKNKQSRDKEASALLATTTNLELFRFQKKSYFQLHVCPPEVFRLQVMAQFEHPPQYLGFKP